MFLAGGGCLNTTMKIFGRSTRWLVVSAVFITLAVIVQGEPEVVSDVQHISSVELFHHNTDRHIRGTVECSSSAMHSTVASEVSPEFTTRIIVTSGHTIPVHPPRAIHFSSLASWSMLVHMSNLRVCFTFFRLRLLPIYRAGSEISFAAIITCEYYPESTYPRTCRRAIIHASRMPI